MNHQPTLRLRGRMGLLGRVRLLGLTAALVTLVTACSTAPPNPPTAPLIPAGWTKVSGGDLSLSLPPWLVAFDTTGAIFANEVTDPGGQGIQLMAEGPGTAEPRPVVGEALEHWLLDRLASPVAGQPVVRQVELPSGLATMIERLDARGTPSAWRITAYAIRTRFGVAFLQIDGPPDAWPARQADAELIPLLLRVGPGRL